MGKKRIIRAISFSSAALVATLILGDAGRASAVTNPAAREMTFEQRVKAQEAIERVYYSHQIDAKLPFEQAVPRVLLEKKVIRYLKQSAALESVWKNPITAAMLGREMARIAVATRFPVDDRDLDGDGISGCGVDCNDADPSSWDIPLEVANFRPNGISLTDWIWDSQASVIGPGVVYDFASGTMSPGGVILTNGTCMGTVSAPQFTDTQPDPALGWGTWFLVLAKNSCLTGTYGSDSQGGDRPVPPCP